jgi:hypothetical protein
MARITIELPDPIAVPGNDACKLLVLDEPVGRHFRRLEQLGNYNAEPARPLSTVLDIVLICAVDPPLTPPIVDTLSLADIEAVSEAVAPFFSRGAKADGPA